MFGIANIIIAFIENNTTKYLFKRAYGRTNGYVNIRNELRFPIK